MNIDQLIGERTREVRLERGLGQEELASTVGMSRTTLVRIERGERPVTVSELVALALALVVPPAALVSPIDRGREPVEVTSNEVTEVSRLYFWWTGIEAPTDERGYAMNASHTLAIPKQGAMYEAALRRHVTQSLFLDAYRKLEDLDHRREMAEDPAMDFNQAPSEVDYEAARSRVEHFARVFVQAMRKARAEGLTDYRVHHDYWPHLARAFGRADPVGWAQDEGIEPYEPEAEA